MKFNVFRLLAGIGIAGILMLVAHWSGLWPKLGAHPYWSISATYLGIALGGGVVFLSAFFHIKFPDSLRYLVGLFILAALMGIWISTQGKADFVASYADDHAAGKLWYYGFIVFISGGVATLSTLIDASIFANKSGAFRGRK